MTLQLKPENFINELWSSKSVYKHIRSGKCMVDAEYNSHPEDSHLISIAFNGNMGYAVDGHAITGKSLSILWVPPYAKF